MATYDVTLTTQELMYLIALCNNTVNALREEQCSGMDVSPDRRAYYDNLTALFLKLLHLQPQ